MRYIVDDVLQPTVTPAHASVELGLAVLALVAMIGLGALVDYWATRLLSGSGLNIANDLRIAVLGRLQRLSLRYHSQQRVGDLVARVTSDVSYTQDMFVQVLSTLLPSLVLVAGMFTVMMIIDPVFTLLAVLATRRWCSPPTGRAPSCGSPPAACARPTARSPRRPPRASARCR